MYGKVCTCNNLYTCNNLSNLCIKYYKLKYKNNLII